MGLNIQQFLDRQRQTETQVNTLANEVSAGSSLTPEQRTALIDYTYRSWGTNPNENSFSNIRLHLNPDLQGLDSVSDAELVARASRGFQHTNKSGSFLSDFASFYGPVIAGGLVAGGIAAAAGGGAAAGGTAGEGGVAAGGAGTEAAMPAAIPASDPTFGGALTQTSPGVYGAGGAATAMPPAVPASDPTFGGELTQTAPGVFENVGNVGAFGTLEGSGGMAMSGGAGALGAMSSAASGGGDGGASGGASGGGSAGAVGGGSALSSFFGEDEWWKRAMMNGLPGLLGAFGSYQQSQDYKDLANQYMGMGAPYRGRLEQLYQNPSSFLQSPEVMAPIQQGTNALAHSLSVKGNPAGSGNALQELQNYASTQLFNRLGQEKDRLGGFGGLTQYNQAAPAAASNAIGAQGNIYGDLGGAAADIFNPPRRYRLEDLLRAY